MTDPIRPFDHMRVIAVDHSTSIMKSNHIWISGCHAIMHSLIMDAQARYEASWSNWTAFSKAKSARDALTIQVDQTHAAIQRNLDGSTRFSNASVKLVKDTLAPLTENMARSLEKASVPAE